MAWLFSKALMDSYENSRCLQGQGEESLAESCLGGEPCALWNGTHTQRASWLPVKMTDALTLSRSGMTYKPLTDDLGQDVLMWCLEGFRVKMLALQTQKAEGLTEGEADCGLKCTELLAKYCHNTHLLKTRQCLLLEEGSELLKALPRWGMIADGELWEVAIPIALCVETESGFLPATVASDGKHHGKEKWIANSRAKRIALGKSPPTEKITYAYYEAGIHAKYFPEISEDVIHWPIGWTDLRPLATDKTQWWLHLHGEFLEGHCPTIGNPVNKTVQPLDNLFDIDTKDEG